MDISEHSSSPTNPHNIQHIVEILEASFHVYQLPKVELWARGKGTAWSLCSPCQAKVLHSLSLAVEIPRVLGLPSMIGKQKKSSIWTSLE